MESRQETVSTAALDIKVPQITVLKCSEAYTSRLKIKFPFASRKAFSARQISIVGI